MGWRGGRLRSSRFRLRGGVETPRPGVDFAGRPAGRAGAGRGGLDREPVSRRPASPTGRPPSPEAAEEGRPQYVSVGRGRDSGGRDPEKGARRQAGGAGVPGFSSTEGPNMGLTLARRGKPLDSPSQSCLGAEQLLQGLFRLGDRIGLWLLPRAICQRFSSACRNSGIRALPGKPAPQSRPARCSVGAVVGSVFPERIPSGSGAPRTAA